MLAVHSSGSYLEAVIKQFIMADKLFSSSTEIYDHSLYSSLVQCSNNKTIIKLVAR